MCLRAWSCFPTIFKTWCLGDGFFIDTTQDPWYVGPTYKGYYMNTDIGYLRFIFYFGLIGLVYFHNVLYICDRSLHIVFSAPVVYDGGASCVAVYRVVQGLHRYILCFCHISVLGIPGQAFDL